MRLPLQGACCCNSMKGKHVHIFKNTTRIRRKSLFFVQDGPTEWNVGTVLGIFLWLCFGLVFPAIMIVGFFGEERARLGVAGLHSERWALISYRRRFVPRSEIRAVRAATVTVQHNSGPIECPVLRFETSAEPLDFALGISEKEQAWLIALVRDFFVTLMSSVDGQDANDQRSWDLHHEEIKLRP